MIGLETSISQIDIFMNLICRYITNPTNRVFQENWRKSVKNSLDRLEKRIQRTVLIKDVVFLSFDALKNVSLFLTPHYFIYILCFCALFYNTFLKKTIILILSLISIESTTKNWDILLTYIRNTTCQPLFKAKIYFNMNIIHM